MIDGSEKRIRQLAFELQNSHVCEKCSNGPEQSHLFTSRQHLLYHSKYVPCLLDNL